MQHLKSHAKPINEGKDKGKISSNVEFMKNFDEQKREQDLNLLTTIEKQVQGVLSEVQYIAETLETNKNVAPIENLNEKIKASYKKIKAYLNLEVSPEQDMNLQANQRSIGGIQVESNPFVKEMGGMPIETISSEWNELIEGEMLDKAELENLVNKKLKDRVELANRLKLQNRLAAQPKLKVGQPLTPKFNKIQNTLKYILKEIPPPPKPTPSRTIPAPRPY